MRCASAPVPSVEPSSTMTISWSPAAAVAAARASATAAFVVALVNNFVWNRLWTFRDSYGRVGAQAARFVLVSTAAFLLSLAVLSVLVRDAGISKLVAQAVAIVAVTPVSFAAN